MSVLSNQTQKLTESMTNNNLSSNSLHGSSSGDGKQQQPQQQQPKRDSRHTISDDDPTTDWIPEIPFWNVSIAS